MQLKFVLSILLLIAIHTESTSQELTANGTKYSLTAKLNSDYRTECTCGYTISNHMMNFKIIDIDMEEYFLSTINIIIPCSGNYGNDFFKKGYVYKIEFFDNCNDMNTDEGVCYSDIPKRKILNRRFWVHSIIRFQN